MHSSKAITRPLRGRSRRPPARGARALSSKALTRPLRGRSGRPPALALRARVVGFTLIEVLVALMVVGILVAGVALSVGDDGAQRRLREEAVSLALLIETAGERALVDGAVLGMRVETGGLRFYRLHEGRWRAASRDVLRPRSFDRALTAELRLDGVAATADEGPQLLLLPDGERTPFTLVLTRRGAEFPQRLVAGPLGPVAVQAP